MEQKRNYQIELESIINTICKESHKESYKETDQSAENRLGVVKASELPRLLLHACCAPCSSYCLEYLCQYFQITVFFYNPNITGRDEYEKRVTEEKRLISCYNDEIQTGKRVGNPIDMIEGDYEPEKFLEMSKGLEDCREGGERCFRCFELRLRACAELMVKEKCFDYFTTTLTISPLKNAPKLNEIGEALAVEYGIQWLPSDFKKKNGYKRSIQLSAEYDLYRQDFCGCGFSKLQRERDKTAKNPNKQEV